MSPTVEALIEHTQRCHQPPHRASMVRSVVETVSNPTIGRVARESVRREHAAGMATGAYGRIDPAKPNDVIRFMYENFSSLSLFLEGNLRHKKVRQINKLMSDYHIDILAGCETRTDWRFVKREEDKFHNLFCGGQNTRGVTAHNINDQKNRRDQIGGTCMMALGRLASSIMETGVDQTGLGRWCWMKIGGGGKFTRTITAYQPTNPRRTTKGETVWDQHVRYYEARGEIRNPGEMFRFDLIALLTQWKADGEEIILLGDFNQNVYTGKLAKLLSEDGIRMHEICIRITGVPLPPTHIRGSIPIDAVFCTMGIDGVAAALLPSRTGVGDHRVFIVDVTSSSVLGDVFPRVIPAAGRLLNCASDKIKNNYIKVLNQLTERHLLFKKLLYIDRDSSEVTNAQLQLRLNKFDKELEEFMKSSERESHKYKRTNIEWSPLAGVWIQRRWLLTRIQRFLSGLTKDPRNLIRECRRRGVTDPRYITPEELRTEFYVCKQNIDHLAKHGPHYRRQFLRQLSISAKQRGDDSRASKIIGLLQREASSKRWKRVNNSTGKKRGSLTISVKVPTTEGGVEEFKTREDVFFAVSKHLTERFQSALSAQCHRGTFFEDIGHLADGPVAQQILEGTYEYPAVLDPATRLLCEEATATYATMAPSQVATYVTVDDFQHFWQTSRERTGSSYSGLHFGHYKAASFCPDLSSLHVARLTICARNGVSLTRWGIGLTVLLEKILGNVFVHKLRAICLLEADFNWWNKLVFAKRMMHQAIKSRSIPQECFAKKGSHCNYATLTKQFFCDSSRCLHHAASIGGCDLGDCYDRTAHIPTSLALQSFGIPSSAIRVLLLSMRTMQYFLKTGFGESSTSFGGTAESPNSGLGQGSGASPPAFLALSSLIVNAYRRMGHGANISSSYVSRLFSLCAVMYVDDTDLLHWPRDGCDSSEDLIEHVQRATTDWGNLTQASGGILKPEKCSVYLLDYKYVRGRAKMKSLRDLPEPLSYITDGDRLLPSHIQVPQPEGPPVPIVTYDVTTSSKMLGTHWSPAGTSATHVEHMVQKGLDWVDLLRTKPLLSRDAWLSFRLQLFPAISWGLVTVILSPPKMDTMYQRVFEKALPFLGVNRKIRKEWRTLPEMFYGLALPNFPLIALAEKISFMLGNWGNKGQAHSDAMAMAYENFIIEVGLYDNPLSWPFDDYGVLSTEGTWFHNLWELSDRYHTHISIRSEDLVTGIRVNDRSLMSEFFRLGYRGRDLVALNIVRRFRNLLHVSDIVKCDGRTIDEYVTSEFSEESVELTFPREEPTPSDFRLWKDAVRLLCGSTTQLPYTLGPYLRRPHLPSEWYTDATADKLFRANTMTIGYELYLRIDDRMRTRHGTRYLRSGTHLGPHGGTHHGSITMISNEIAVLHSRTVVYVPESRIPSFKAELQQYGNASMWSNLSIDGDGEWIRASIGSASLVIAHDGSFMPEQSSDMCSAGTIIYCRHTSQWLKVSIVERSTAASNYRGELLGAIMALYVVRAATVGESVPQPCIQFYCDNKGVLSHGNAPRSSLPEKQQQADLIRILKHLSTTSIAPIQWVWVEGHAVELKGWQNCTLFERLNHQADMLAKSALIAGINGDTPMDGDFPLEPIQIRLSGQRVSGSIREALESDWGYRTARALFDDKDIVRTDDFEIVWWDGLRKAMDGYPKMYCVWLTKQVSEFCGNNVQRYYWSKGQFSPKCDFCLTEDEYTMHICRCQEVGRDRMFQVTIRELTTWIQSTLRDNRVAATVEKYILGRGEILMTDCVNGADSLLLAAAVDTDRLGWDSLIEGRISVRWLDVAAPLLLQSRQKLLPQVWGTKLINRLHNIVHKQWIYRNSVIHYQGNDGLTIPEQQEIMDQVALHSFTDPDSLLPRHRSLMDINFAVLGTGPTSDRITWLANMQSAIATSALSQAGTLTPAAELYFAKG